MSRSRNLHAATCTARVVLLRGNGVATHDPLALPSKVYKKPMKRGNFVLFECEWITTIEGHMQHGNLPDIFVLLSGDDQYERLAWFP